MSETSNLELPTELKLRIERVAKDRNEEACQPAFLRYRFVAEC